MAIVKADITVPKTDWKVSALDPEQKLTAFEVNELKRVTDSLVDQAGGSASYVAVAVNYLALTSDGIIEVTAAGVTVTLPTAIVATAGFRYVIDNSSHGNVNVVGQGGETIQGASAQTIPTQSSMTVYTNGTGWRIV